MGLIYNVVDMVESTRCALSVWNKLENKVNLRGLYGDCFYHPEITYSKVENKYSAIDEIIDIIFEVKNTWNEGKILKKSLECNKSVIISNDLFSNFSDLFFERDNDEVYTFIRLKDMTVKRGNKYHDKLAHMVLDLISQTSLNNYIKGVVWQFEKHRSYTVEIDYDIVQEIRETFIKEILSNYTPTFNFHICQYCKIRDKCEFDKDYKNIDNKVSL